MPDPTLLEVMDALAEQIADELAAVQDLQVVGRMNLTPQSIPSIDIYPGDPFQEPAAFGGKVTVGLTIRARVNTVEHEGAQDLLLSLMDPSASTSVMAAVESDRTLGGTVQDIVCDPPSDFGAYIEPDASGALLGCTWRARVTY